MRVQVGNHAPRMLKRTTMAGMQGLNEIEQQIGTDLANSVTAESAEVSERWLEELADVVREAALQESGRMFPAIEALITGRPGAMGFSGSNLPYVRTLAYGDLNSVVDRSDSVSWDDLSNSHIHRKAKHHPESVNQMFRYSGRLAKYFSSANVGRNFVTGKLGGVEVKINRAYFHKNNLTQVNPLLAETFTRDRISKSSANKRAGRTIANLLLGSVTVEIFPRLATSLLPMLSSNRWSDSGDGDLERALFPGKSSSMGAKLVNKSNPYRPLLTPVIQYWIALQMPDTILRRVRARFNRSEGRAGAMGTDIKGL